jgi:DNA-binding transcriptional LysR family regulator
MADLEWLRTFLAVYRAGSITRAAKTLHLTQPAVSQQIRALESALAQSLFVRLPRGVAPTADAHELARVASTHVDVLESLLTTERAANQSVSGTVHGQVRPI